MRFVDHSGPAPHVCDTCADGSLPTGKVTFLFTDIEGSTRLWETQHAAWIWGAAERLRAEVGSPLPLNDRPRYDRRVAAARAAVGYDTAFDHPWQEGRALTLEQAIELALEEIVEQP